jgi:histidinol-phosphate aminotransferase
MREEAVTLLPAPRPEVMATPSAQHGALDYAELGDMRLAPDAVLDFSVNSNPFGPSPAVAAALAQVALDRYPDREALALRSALARHLGISPAQIVAGNGTAELIHLIAFAFVRPGDRVLVIGPTFGEYSRAAGLMGARVEAWMAQAGNTFAVDCDAVARTLYDTRPRLLFVCRPNNPTGTLLPLEAIRTWAEASPETLLVVDEAYLAFAEAAQSCLVLDLPNVLSLRSMTKDYALAALRLGYAAGRPQVVESLARVRPAWNVNALAQAAGLAALDDQAHVQRTLDLLRVACSALVSGLTRLGFAPVPSTVHFFLVNVGDAGSLRRKLMQKGIQVRDCASFGLPAYIRIATRRPDDNLRLLGAMREGMP